MDTVMTPNGVVTIFDSRDAYEIADQYVGTEFATIIKDMIDDAKGEVEYYQDAYDAVKDDTEATAEYWTNILMDTRAVLSQLVDKVNKLKKTEIESELYKVIRDINNKL